VSDIIDELISKKPEKKFLNNKINLKCSTCGHSEKSTYYTLLKEHQFEVLEPTSVSNTFIRESMYEEEITASPIYFKKKCPKCSNQLEAISPVPLEYIMNILQSAPPDDIMYG
jgi:DNA-directed RNA polymerase subunit M/transcription elongation factor TFIIS